MVIKDCSPPRMCHKGLLPARPDCAISLNANVPVHYSPSLRLSGLAPLAVARGASSTGSQTGSSSGHSDQSGAQRILAAFGERLSEASLAVPKMCCAAYLALRQPLRQVIVATCDSKMEGTAAVASGSNSLHSLSSLLDAVHTAFVPDKAVVVIDLCDEESVRFFTKVNPEALAMAKRHFAVHPGEL